MDWLQTVLIGDKMNKSVALTLVASLLLFICYSCSSSYDFTSDIVNVNLGQSGDDSVVFKNYIELDGMYPVSSENIVLDLPDKIVTHKGKIFILDKMESVIYEYNIRTHMLELFLDRRGHSRQEYLCIEDFVVDKSGNLIIYDNDAGKVIYYNSKGKYLKSFGVVLGGGSMTIFDDGKIAIDCCYSEKDVSVMIYSSDGKLLTKIHHDSYYKNLAASHENSLKCVNNGLIYVRPYDYTIYRTVNDEVTELFSLDFGKRNINIEDLDGLDYPDFLKLLRETKSVFWLRHLCALKNKYFLSTNMSDNILYDADKHSTYILSNMKFPYGFMLSSSLFIDDKGDIYTIVSDSNVENALRPWMDYTLEVGDKIPAFLKGVFRKKFEHVVFWLLKGHIK